ITKLILIKLNLWQRDLYIIGSGDNAIVTYKLLLANEILGYTFLGFINLNQINSPSEIEINKRRLLVFDEAVLLDRSVESKFVDAEIVFALSSQELLNYSKLINILQTKYTFVSIVPDIAGLPLYGVELNHFFGNDQLFLRLQNNLGRRFNRTIK